MKLRCQCGVVRTQEDILENSLGIQNHANLVVDLPAVYVAYKCTCGRTYRFSGYQEPDQL